MHSHVIYKCIETGSRIYLIKVFIKKTNTMTKNTLRVAILATALSASLGATAFAFNTITSQLDPGETNANVTSLQQFLASTPSLYPEGLVTGYYGSLTTRAVVRFQAANGLDQVGRVGPLTRDRINAIINAGGSVSTTVGGPAVVMPYAPQTGTNSATFNWMTLNGSAYGRVYYSTMPLQMNEGDINSRGFAITSGQSAAYDMVARASQSATVTGLQPNTMYYYTIVATDVSGNVSLIGPNNTFRTNAQ